MDTSADVTTMQLEHWRAMSPAEKLAQVDELNQACYRLAAAGARQRYPEASDEEVHLRVLALSLDRDLMIAAYGWDPVLKGR